MYFKENVVKRQIKFITDPKYETEYQQMVNFPMTASLFEIFLYKFILSFTFPLLSIENIDSFTKHFELPYGISSEIVNGHPL